MNSEVYVAGSGCTKFGELHDRDAGDLAREASFRAVEDAGVEMKDVDAFYVGTVRSGAAGSFLAGAIGVRGRPVTRVENFCASGMDAVIHACIAVMSGSARVALAVGVEKLRDALRRGLGFRAGHPVWGFGATPPGLFALAANRYMHEYGIGRETLAKVAVKNHRNGAKNPLAHFRREVTLERVLKAPIVAYPFGVFDCSAVTDGAAAVVVAARDAATGLGKTGVTIKGFGSSVMHGNPMYDPAFEYLGFPVTEEAARKAYGMAGIGDPLKELDFAEVHDCFTMTEILNYEDLGFAPKGEGWKMVEEGATEFDGRFPVNPSGGLKSFGHPVGATGARMIFELHSQILGRCGERQLGKADVGLAHNVGGPGTVSSVMILGRT
ncbi:MAG: acetyl-CoA acetyltransferase [bacterium]